MRPGELTNHCDFHLFKKGIKPLWEDEANRYGGKFLKRFDFFFTVLDWKIFAMLFSRKRQNDGHFSKKSKYDKVEKI